MWAFIDIKYVQNQTLVGFYSLPRKSSLSSFKTSKAVLVAGEE
jgi:hypothetical protein